MNTEQMKRLVEARGGGLRGLVRFEKEILKPLLEGRTLESGEKIKKKPEEFSIRAFWEVCVGPVEKTLPIGKMDAESLLRLHESSSGGMSSSMFPILTGNLIQQAIIDGYENPGFIGDSLVRTIPSNLKSMTMSGLTSAQGSKVVKETERYQESSRTDKYATTDTEKHGRIISLSEEAITHDQTGELVDSARELGFVVGQDREVEILEAVTGVDTEVYKPGGVAETLYDASNNNLVTSNPLDDWSAIETALLFHKQNIKDDRQEETGRPILWMPNILLVPTELMMDARRIVNATEIREVTNTNTTTLSANPVAGAYTVLTSPLLPGPSTSWYLGEFQRQFVWHEVWRLETFTQSNNSEAAFERDIIQRFKVRYYGGCNAKDHVWVLRNNAS